MSNALYETRVQVAKEIAQRSNLGDGVIDFDDVPKTSASDDGAYVQCWIWVGNRDTHSVEEDGVCPECLGPIEGRWEGRLFSTDATECESCGADL